MPPTPRTGYLGVTLSGGTMINVPAPHQGPEYVGVPGFSLQALYVVSPATALPKGVTIAQKAVGTGTTNEWGWKGTPCELGVFTFTVTNSGGGSAGGGGDYTWTITRLCALVVLDPSSPLDDLLQGVAAVVIIGASGGVAPYVYDVVDGTLPTGLTLSSSGRLSGTPTVPGDYEFAIRATDNNGCPGVTVYTVTVRGIRIDIATGSPATLADHTDDVLQADFELGLNQRSTAHLVFGDGFIPDRLAEVVLYGRDGITPVFGGIILKRTVRGMDAHVSENACEADCVDFSIYFDDAAVTLTYATAVAVETVIADIVTQVLGDYGLTYTPTATGLTMDPFSWVDVVVTTAFKQISDKTGIVFRTSPTKAILAFVPGTDPAPIAIADANINTFDLNWSDGERLTVNTVELFCGPSGSGLMRQQWIATGVQTSWVTDLPAIDPAPILVEIDDGVTPRLATVVPVGGGSPSAGQYEWDRETHTLTLGTDPIPAAGTIITLGSTAHFDSPFTFYTVQFPFKVRVTTGALPPITYRENRPDCVEYAAGLELANGILDRERVARRDLEVTTDEDGFFPGQALTVNTTSRGGLVGVFLVASVRAHLITDEIWDYTVMTQEESTYHGSYVDQWKALTSGGGSVSSSATLSAPVDSSVVESDLSLSDLTTADVSTTKHGFAPKAPNDITKFLNGLGAWTAPGASVPNFSAATVATSETQASGAAYGDLATPGPSVTLTLVGTVAIIWLSATASKGSSGNSAFLSVDVSGASTVAASDADAAAVSATASHNLNLSRVLVLTGLTPGSNTFTLKHRNDGGGTWTFFDRSVAVYAP